MNALSAQLTPRTETMSAASATPSAARRPRRLAADRAHGEGFPPTGTPVRRQPMTLRLPHSTTSPPAPSRDLRRSPPGEAMQGRRDRGACQPVDSVDTGFPGVALLRRHGCTSSCNAHGWASDLAQRAPAAHVHLLSRAARDVVPHGAASDTRRARAAMRAHPPGARRHLPRPPTDPPGGTGQWPPVAAAAGGASQPSGRGVGCSTARAIWTSVRPGGRAASTTPLRPAAGARLRAGTPTASFSR